MPRWLAVSSLTNHRHWHLYSHKISTSCDFRPPDLRKDYRSPEIHSQRILLLDV